MVVVLARRADTPFSDAIAGSEAVRYAVEIVLVHLELVPEDVRSFSHRGAVVIE